MPKREHYIRARLRELAIAALLVTIFSDATVLDTLGVPEQFRRVAAEMVDDFERYRYASSPLRLIWTDR